MLTDRLSGHTRGWLDNEGCGCSTADPAQCGNGTDDCELGINDPEEAYARGLDFWIIPLDSQRGKELTNKFETVWLLREPSTGRFWNGSGFVNTISEAAMFTFDDYKYWAAVHYPKLNTVFRWFVMNDELSFREFQSFGGVGSITPGYFKPVIYNTIDCTWEKWKVPVHMLEEMGFLDKEVKHWRLK